MRLTTAMRWCLIIRMENQQNGNIARQQEAMKVWEPRRQEIVALYQNGTKSQAAMAQIYGVTQTAFQKAIARMGIPPKSRGRSGSLNGRYIDGTKCTSYRQMVEKTHCNRCGARNQLLVHHVDGCHTNNVTENLEVLCSPCHSSHHKQQWWDSRKDGQS